MEVARKLDIEKVVFCSSASVYGYPQFQPVTEEHPLRPLNLYGVTKVSGEQILDTYYENYGIDTVSLRFGNIYGVGLYTHWDTVIPIFINQAFNNKPITVFGDGEYTRDFVHVLDIVQAITLSLTTRDIGGEVFNVGGETKTVNQVAKTVEQEYTEATGKPVKITNKPPRKGETKEFSYDLTQIKTRLGFQNRWTVKQGIKQIIKYKQNKSTKNRSQNK